MSYVLSLEDDLHIQQFLSVNLVARGILVKTATTVSEALSLALEDQPKLVILDMKTPDADGTDFLRAALDNPTLRDVPVIIFTGSSTEQSYTDVAEFTNVVDYLVKPISVNGLLKAVNQALGASAGRR